MFSAASFSCASKSVFGQLIQWRGSVDGAVLKKLTCAFCIVTYLITTCKENNITLLVVNYICFPVRCDGLKKPFIDLSSIPRSVLGKVRILFRTKFSKQCDLVLPLSISSILFFSLGSSRSCLHLLSRLPVNSTLRPIFPSLAWFRRQVLRKMWSIQLKLPLFSLYEYIRHFVATIFVVRARLIETVEWLLMEWETVDDWFILCWCV
jgi:hypothetical protein